MSSDVQDNTYESIGKELSLIESQVLHEYIKNGFIASRAYLAVRPDVDVNYASFKAGEILKRPHVAEALEMAKRKFSVKVDKNALLVRTGSIVDKAEQKEQYSAALKGIELQGRFIGAFDSEEGDEQKYIQFITKISGKNVTVINSASEDNRKVEVHGSDS
jgi:hypothetical protein